MNMVSMIALIVSSMLVFSTPLIFTAVGGTFSEHSGVVNVGLEGIMVMGAFSAVVFNLTFADTFGKATPWLALIVAGVVGIAISALHAVATINFRADHIVSGTVINLLAPALSVFLVKAIYAKGQTDNIAQSFGYFSFPGLSKIPVIGQIFFKNTSVMAYIAIVIAIIAWWIQFRTKFGLRLRSVGENPQAADTLGINVYGYKYAGVLLSGLLGGIGGAVFAQSISGNFSAGTIVGQGFISMAAMIFGKWNPIGAMGAALFFGFAQSLSIIGGQLPGISKIPSVYLQCAPYVLTILVLVLFLGKAVGPKANGTNYIKSK
ncbi:ABC superfamily ATP binding cassette transporter, membrane protein [Lapidilactobacillus concavus DSM 17758]|uniref:ABC superfamily ATP binding cassette transporter, membrane protein n=1 Tax=Lapidilactobacillus concavus DSM 17758 TaxID=1423735 RepID=A0A0R1VZN3_9LACO|nr:ABC transporter permease [Lapidilactobacillus concavus]KRM10970.1 ABC superfamily ATP binding cassette transporter, membrane protein [Lapidilactobacillus concavus DSM 17758]GEL13918.1 ABC transporter permease [Lapidilactobacillus concavus]